MMFRRLRITRQVTLLACTCMLALTACRVTDLQLWGPANKVAPPDAIEVVRVRDIAYRDDKDADPLRHHLDIYLPKGKRDFPVVVLVHGGAWMMGDNRCCGLYSTVGEFLASRGIGAVLPNYRLSPSAKHPDHVRDVARAVAWTRKHIGEHGGKRDQLFLAGHSAGGHLVTLLATDEKYLREVGLRTADIKGVIGLSGVYRIPEGKSEIFLGGNSARALRMEAMSPLRGSGEADKSCPFELPGMPISVDIFRFAFGDDVKVREEASPVAHVRKGLPPFLLFSASRDLPLLPEMAEEFQHALVKHGVESKLLRIDNRNHNTIMFRAIVADDPVARAMLEFVHQRVAK